MLQQNISFNVNNQILTADRLETELAENSVNYLTFSVDFEKPWDENLFLTACFESHNRRYFVNLDKEPGDTYKVPFEAIKSPGFSIYILGSDVVPKFDFNGNISFPTQCRKRISTTKINIKVNITGKLQGNNPQVNEDEVIAIEQANLALQVAKEAYTTMWNMQYSLREINDLLGGDPYALCKIESTIQEILKTVNGTQIKKDQFGIPQLDEEGNYIFEEVAK